MANTNEEIIIKEFLWSDNAPYHYYAPATPLPGNVGKEVGICLYKIQMHYLLGLPVSQIPTMSLPT